MSDSGCEDGDTWTNLRDLLEAELANVVTVCKGEQEKGIKKITQGSDMAPDERQHHSLKGEHWKEEVWPS